MVLTGWGVEGAEVRGGQVSTGTGGRGRVEQDPGAGAVVLWGPGNSGLGSPGNGLEMRCGSLARSCRVGGTGRSRSGSS